MLTFPKIPMLKIHKEWASIFITTFFSMLVISALLYCICVLYILVGIKKYICILMYIIIK